MLSCMAALCLTLFSSSSPIPVGVRAEGPCTKPPNPNILPIPQGAMAATCFAGSVVKSQLVVNLNDPVVGIVDVRNPAGNGAVQGLNWCPDMYHNENGNAANKWTPANLGQVYGVTLDNAPNPNIYVAASSVYGSFPSGNWGPGGTGGEVYKLDGTNGNISLFGGNHLPNGGEGLGNLSFHAAKSQFFVSNFADGRIYRLNALGAIQSTFDHATGTITNNATPDPNDGPGFARLGERVWGVQEFRGRLYYSVWGKDWGRPNPPNNTDNQIWSIALDASGNFTGTKQLEITIPSLPGFTYSNPTSDIAFSPSGTMFLAERSRLQDKGMMNQTDAHQSRVLEYQLSGTNWVPSGRNFSVGNHNYHWNSAGGIDLDCDGDVWMTGDALVLTPANGRPPSLPPDPTAYTIYGLQKSPASGNTGGKSTADLAQPTYVGLNSYYVDLNGQTQTIANTTDKTMIGSLEIYKRLCGAEPQECAGITKQEISCKTETTGGYNLTFNVTNNTGQPVTSILVTPPPGSTFTITSQTPSIPGGVLQPGTTIPVSVTIGGGQPGQEICFTVTLMTKEGKCCTVRVCQALPFCCATAKNIKLGCSPFVPGGGFGYTYTLSITNQTSNLVQHIYLHPPAGVTMTPNYFAVSLAPGATFNTPPIIITGITAGASLNFGISLHTGDMKVCCTISHFAGVMPSCHFGFPSSFNKRGQGLFWIKDAE